MFVSELNQTVEYTTLHTSHMTMCIKEAEQTMTNTKY